MRIVLIDSNPCTTEKLGMLLKDQGHTVLTAFSGRAGIALGLAAEPDLVIVSFDLDDVKGADVMKTLHRTPSRNRCAFIALVERKNSRSSQCAIDAGASFIFANSAEVSELVLLTKHISQAS